MKVAFLANANNIHTQRWVNALTERNVEVFLISQHGTSDKIHPSVKQFSLPYKGLLGYFLNTFKVKKLLSKLKPDLLNAHYATGYGTLGRFSAFKPYLLSVWGADVFDAPEQSLVMRHLVKQNIASATAIGSTSYCMKKRTEELADSIHPPIHITPFGVDTLMFKHSHSENKCKVVIGTVKVLHPKYGIDTLMEGFARFVSTVDDCDEYILRIVGDGPQRKELERLAVELNIDKNTEFVGRVDHSRVPCELNKLDIYVAVSRFESESFGVAILEASACEKPVIVSNAGGLTEVVKDGETGFIIERENPEELANKLRLLCENKILRENMGRAGRNWVQQQYSWHESVDTMLNVYKSLIN